MKKLLNIIFCLTLLICLFACNASSSVSDEIGNNEKMSFDTATTSQMYEENGFNEVDDEDSTNKTISKIIYTASINLETKDFDSTIEALNKKITKYEGYVTNRETYTYGEDNKYINAIYEIRVPSKNYNAFLNEKDDIGSVTSITENANDVTEEYIDLTARLENLKLEEETIQGLFNKATEISEILKIETKLSEVRGDIESLESKIKYYDTVTDYATITIYIDLVNQYTSNKTFIEKLGDLFKDSFDSFKNVLYEILSFVVYTIPYLIIIAIVVLIIIKVRKNKVAKKKGD